MKDNGAAVMHAHGDWLWNTRDKVAALVGVVVCSGPRVSREMGDLWAFKVSRYTKERNKQKELFFD